MSGVRPILAALRVKGVSIRSERGRLIVDAPWGAISPDLRAKLLTRKTELIEALGVEARLWSDDPIARESLSKVAVLLAKAYEGYSRVQRLEPNRPDDSVQNELALSALQSVHECGQLP